MEKEEINEEEIISFLNEVDKGYIGLGKPKVNFIKESEEPRGYWYWERVKVSKKYGIPLSEIDEEPDNHPADPEQAWA